MTEPTRGMAHDQHGFALMGTLLVLVLMLTLGSATMMYSVFDLKSTTHYNTSIQAMYASEAGILHALNAMNRTGVVDFDTDVVDRWSSVFSLDPQSLPGHGGFTYQVQVTADPVSPATRGMLTSIGLAPNNARRIVRAAVTKGTIATGRGAVYLPVDSASPQFSGTAFGIDGNDHDQFGAPVPGGVVEAGIATRSDAVTASVKSSLDTQQQDNVKGLAFSLDPLNPSVVTVGGPADTDLDLLIANILTNPNVVVASSSTINHDETFGSVALPQITHFTFSNVEVTGSGSASGAGIIILDGALTINGTLDFRGWMIVRGDTIIHRENDGDTTSATVLGSLWTSNLIVSPGSSATINFCEFCLTLADNIPGAQSGYLPKVMNVTSWEEVL